MPGGASAYRKGAAHERHVANELRAAGALVVRSPQSGQAMDLTVIWPRGRWLENGRWLFRLPDWLVQCKLRGYMRPAERKELIELAERYNCIPVLAGGRNPVKYTDLSTGGALEIRADESVRPDPAQGDRAAVRGD